MRSKPIGVPAQRKPVASMARGTSRKPKDNLTLDAMDARAAGMTYGKWKAQHPNTKEANEERLAPAQKPREQVRRVYEIVCAGCGKTFLAVNPLRLYCDDHCKMLKDSEKYRNRHKNTSEEDDK